MAVNERTLRHVERMKLYKTIVADPPWPYNRKWDTGSDKSALAKKYNTDSVPMSYPTMTIQEIMSLPVKEIAADNCELYLWTTQKYLPWSFQVLGAWGFKYCQTLTWCKTPMGTGQGGLYCPTTEFLILGRRGVMPEVKRIDTTWWQIKRQMRHSKKPEFFIGLIESVSHPPRIELFARRYRLGWDVYGNEVESDINL